MFDCRALCQSSWHGVVTGRDNLWWRCRVAINPCDMCVVCKVLCVFRVRQLGSYLLLIEIVQYTWDNYSNWWLKMLKVIKYDVDIDGIGCMEMTRYFDSKCLQWMHAIWCTWRCVCCVIEGTIWVRDMRLIRRRTVKRH